LRGARKALGLPARAAEARRAPRLQPTARTVPAPAMARRP
jgi:hypothetical protein